MEFNTEFFDNREWLGGIEQRVSISIDMFEDETPCLSLVTEEGEPWSDVNKRVPQALDKDSGRILYVPDYSEFTGMPKLLADNGIINKEPIEGKAVHSGFVKINAYQMTDAFFEHYKTTIDTLKSQNPVYQEKTNKKQKMA